MRSTRTTDSSADIQRLPPNRRRGRVPPEQRKRVAKACNGCNVRRIKCSGQEPCQQCSAASRLCVYPSPPEEKVTISKAVYESLLENQALLRAGLEVAVPLEHERTEILRRCREQNPSVQVNDRSFKDDVEVDSPQSRETNDLDKGRVLQDPDGHKRYLGESSGAAFLDRLREFVGTVLPLVSSINGSPGSQNFDNSFTALLGRYQTHDSRPLFLPQVDPYYLPSWGEIESMLTLFRLSAGDSNGTSECGGIYYWADFEEIIQQAYQVCEIGSGMMTSSSFLCVLNAVFALACQYTSSYMPGSEADFGESYFARAKLLLGNPMEDATLVRMQGLALMGFYLLGMNRRDAAYLYICLAVQTSISHGLHRGWLTDERAKRQFWTLYILDRWLSCLMGRPAMLSNDVINIGLPVDTTGYPPAAGLRAHAELSMIMGEVVSKVYGVGCKDRGFLQISSHVDSLLDKLNKWLNDLSQSLQLQSHPGKSNCLHCLSLHMNYNQLIILTTRPLLFLTVKQAIARRYIPQAQKSDTIPDKNQVHMCSSAARNNALLIRQLMGSLSYETSRVLPAHIHYSFNVAIILQLNQLRFEGNVSPGSDASDVDFVIDLLLDMGSKGNDYAQDCARVLVDFGSVVRKLSREEVHSQESVTHFQWPGGQQAFLCQTDPPSAQEDLARQPLDEVVLPAMGNLDAYDELMSWLQGDMFE